MKLDINNVAISPKHSEFTLCIHGSLEQTSKNNIKNWVEFHNISYSYENNFTNFQISGKKMSELFLEKEPFKYIDGFSPNLNKNLHIGHFSNLIIAKAFQSLGLGQNYISILGDTLTGKIEKTEAFNTFQQYIDIFGYHIDKILFASNMKLKNNDVLQSGTEKYEKSQVFIIKKNNEEKQIVGIKSTGETTYFYQDVAMAQELNGTTLYLTGYEQNQHFDYLQQLYPTVHHIGLGLVKINGVKMSSRDNSVIEIKEVLNFLVQEFEDKFIAYNVFAGYILQSSPENDKKINIDDIKNPKTSLGLYISYTMARINTTGLIVSPKNEFNTQFAEFALLKSKYNYCPNILFKELCEMCKKINVLYTTYKISGCPENHHYFIPLYQDILLASKLLGLFIITKIK